jgi:hypothetical protein
MAVTSKVWSPVTDPVAAASWVAVYVFGDVQTVSGAPSSEHWKTASGSSDENSNSAVASVVATAGPLSIRTTGGVRSPISQP